MRKLSVADDLWFFALQPILETTFYCGFLNNIDRSRAAEQKTRKKNFLVAA
jgi:hypothetical protein